MRKTDLEPRVPLAILRLFSVLILVLGCLAGIVELGSGPRTSSDIAAGVEMIIAAIVLAALLSVIAAICDNLIEIRRELTWREQSSEVNRNASA